MVCSTANDGNRVKYIEFEPARKKYKDIASYEDWCCSSFKQLALCQQINPGCIVLEEFKALWCAQCIEQILKALLIKTNKIKFNSELRNYNHNFKKVFQNIKLSKRIKKNLFRNFSVIGNEFYHSFGNLKHKFSLSRELHFTDEDIKLYGPDLVYFSFYLDLLAKSYIETRYPTPFEDSQPYKYYKDNESRLYPLLYEDIYIIVATIRTYKAIIKILGNSAKRYLWENFTWDAQRKGFEAPTEQIIASYKEMQRLVEFILEKKKTFVVENLRIKNLNLQRSCPLLK